MGIFTDYFAATRDEALACADHGPHETGLPAVELKWVDPAVLLGQLRAAIDGVPYDVHRHAGDGELLSPPDSQSRWLVQITEDCRAALASVTDDRVPALAAEWSQAEEWISPNPEDCAEIIPLLRDVALAAALPGKNLYCWICL